MSFASSNISTSAFVAVFNSETEFDHVKATRMVEEHGGFIMQNPIYPSTENLANAGYVGFKGYMGFEQVSVVFSGRWMPRSNSLFLVVYASSRGD